MRLFNPEWEAIKEFEHSARVRDVYYDLAGHELPEDHGDRLMHAILACLPWLADLPLAAIQPIHGAASGHGTLVINKRAKLMLRLPIAALEQAPALCGHSLELGCGRLQVGHLKIKPLLPFGYLYAPCVDLGTGDEAAFLARARAALSEMGVEAGLIPGKARKMQVAHAEVSGYSLMLHDLTLPHSIIVQEQGLGGNRLRGCGVFVPHKSIKEVAPN